MGRGGLLGGAGGTSYWFLSKTEGGAVGEDRIVLPIMPGTHWRDAKPLVLPGLPAAAAQDAPLTLPGGALVKPRSAAHEQPKLTKAEKAAILRSQSAHLGGVPLGKKAVIRGGRIQYVERTDYVPDADAPEPWEAARKPRAKRTPRPRFKNDPKHVAAARDLRDRFLDEINSGGGHMLPAANGKYDVSRQLAAGPCTLTQAPLEAPLLDAA